MQFIQPLLLLGAAAIAAPILLHLLFRPKPRIVELGSIQFLQEVLQQHTRRQRLRHWTLLAIRCLALIVLAVLFARPFIQQPQPSGASGRLVVLIDASASMARASSGEMLWRRALREAEQRLQEVPAGQEAVVGLFDQEVHALRNNEQVDSPLVAAEIVAQLQDLRARGPGLGGTDYLAALRWALGQCQPSDGARSNRVCLITDLQQTSAIAVDAWPKDIDVEIVDLKPDAGDAPNLFVREAVPAKHVLRPGEAASLLIDVQPKNVSLKTPLSLRIELQSGGERKQLETKLEHLEDRHQVELPALGPGVWHGEVVVESADAAESDDARHFALLVEPRYKVLLIDGDLKAATPASDAQFLEAAVRLAPAGQEFEQGPFLLTTKTTAQPDALEGVDQQQVVMVTNVPSVHGVNVGSLLDFVRRGGGLMLFLGGDGSTAASELLTSQLGISQLRSRAADGVPFQLATWDAEHPIFAPFQGSEQGVLERVAFTQIAESRVSEDWRTLATFQSGHAAIFERTLGKGRVLAVATGCGTQSGNWPRTAAYLPLVHQLLLHLVGRADPRPIRYMTADFDHPAGIRESGGRWLVANAAASESEHQAWTPLAFRQKFALPLPSLQPVPSTSTMAAQSSPDRLRPNEWWPWLAVALLCLLTLDTILANRVRF